MSLSKVIEVARGELGVTEVPAGSNRVKYWDDYDPKMQGQPWCVAFLWSIFQHAGERMAFFGGGKTASCSILLRWYKEQGLTVPVEDVQPGDIVLLNFHGGKDPEHCGLVTDVGKRWNGYPYYITIEGNTTSMGVGGTDESNGGCVATKTRYPSQIVAVCRPQYKEEEMSKDDITGHWAEDAIRRCMKRKIITGFPDGTFRPNEPVTRAEAATMIDRLVQLLIGEDDLK